MIARDVFRDLGFPVHQVIIAQHSPVLSSVLDKPQLNNKYFEAHSQTLPYIPMIEDSCSATRIALAYMYTTNDKQTAAEMAPPQIKLDVVPAAASKLDFAHKDGMIDLLIQQEVDTQHKWKRLPSASCLICRLTPSVMPCTKFR